MEMTLKDIAHELFCCRQILYWNSFISKDGECTRRGTEKYIVRKKIPFTMFECYKDTVKKQHHTPALPLCMPLLIMIILEDNYPMLRKGLAWGSFLKFTSGCLSVWAGAHAWERRRLECGTVLGAQALDGQDRWETFAIQASAACITQDRKSVV